nr:hypothetical protein [uncultured Chryseobacterium sp.]
MIYFLDAKTYFYYAYFQGAKDRINRVDSLKRMDKATASLATKS